MSGKSEFIRQHQITDFLSSLLDDSNRQNTTPERYWHPLNLATYGVEEIEAALECMLKFKTSMSIECKKFEDKYASYLGVNHSIFVNSGSSADLLAISSLTSPPNNRLSVGDKVLVPCITWPTQVWSIIQAGLEPVLYDCNRDTFSPDISTVSSQTLEQCKAIFTTHVLGFSADMNELLELCQKYDLILLEDTCESFGAKFAGQYLGTFGLISTFSCFFSHHITTMEGGMICTNDINIQDQLKVMRSHGWSRALDDKSLTRYSTFKNINLNEYKTIDKRYLFLDHGYNLRPTELQGAFGIQQLEKVNHFNNTRKKLSNIFYDGIKSLVNFSSPEIHPSCEPCFMALPMSITSPAYKNSHVIKLLESNGVETRPLIAGNIYNHPVTSNRPLKAASSLEGGNWHHNRSFYIGLSPFHDESNIYKLIDLFNTIDKEL